MKPPPASVFVPQTFCYVTLNESCKWSTVLDPTTEWRSSWVLPRRRPLQFSFRSFEDVHFICSLTFFACWGTDYYAFATASTDTTCAKTVSTKHTIGKPFNLARTRYFFFMSRDNGSLIKRAQLPSIERLDRFSIQLFADSYRAVPFTRTDTWQYTICSNAMNRQNRPQVPQQTIRSTIEGHQRFSRYR